ncbi:MAG: hypothetical protein K0M39_14780 [Rhizobium sp.]|nr:hypothetical protein [Rhizobium sp.]
MELLVGLVVGGFIIALFMHSHTQIQSGFARLQEHQPAIVINGRPTFLRNSYVATVSGGRIVYDIGSDEELQKVLDRLGEGEPSAHGSLALVRVFKTPEELRRYCRL